LLPSPQAAFTCECPLSTRNGHSHWKQTNIRVLNLAQRPFKGSNAQRNGLSYPSRDAMKRSGYEQACPVDVELDFGLRSNVGGGIFTRSWRMRRSGGDQWLAAAFGGSGDAIGKGLGRGHQLRQ
jgi:hypothetical protein